MAHGLLNQNMTQALNIDALNRSAVGAADLDNGNLVVLATLSATAGEGEVWAATRPESGTLVGTWMVADPEVVTVYGVDGNAYKGLSPDPRNFYIKTGAIFRAFKPQIGDIIELSTDAIATGAGVGAAYAVVTASSYKLAWSATAVSGLSLRLVSTSYTSLATGSIGDTQRVTTYKFVVEAV